MSANEPGWLRPTPRYDRVLGRADEIARPAGSAMAGPEHLLLAIVHERESVPAQALAGLVDLDRVEASVLEAVNSRGHSAAANPARSPAAVAVEMGHAYVGVEHVFLGIIRDRGSVATQALARLIDPARAEAAVLDVMNTPAYRGQLGGAGIDRLFIPQGIAFDEQLRAAMVECTPAGATFGFNWENSRPWVHVTEPGNTREVLNAALARLGRPGAG